MHDDFLLYFGRHDLTDQLSFSIFKTCVIQACELFCWRIFSTVLICILISRTTPLGRNIAALLSGLTSNFIFHYVMFHWRFQCKICHAYNLMRYVSLL